MCKPEGTLLQRDGGPQGTNRKGCGVLGHPWEGVQGSAVLMERSMGIDTLMEMHVRPWGTHGWLDSLPVQGPTLAQACERTCGLSQHGSE